MSVLLLIYIFVFYCDDKTVSALFDCGVNLASQSEEWNTFEGKEDLCFGKSVDVTI